MPLLFALLLSISRPDLIQIPRAEAEVLTTDDLRTIAAADAALYKINSDKFLKVIDCESQFDPNTVSATGDYGVAQINLKYHSEITKAQALDPIFSLRWAAGQWSANRQKLWSCWNALYGKHS